MKKQTIFLGGFLLLVLVLVGCTLGGQGGGPNANPTGGGATTGGLTGTDPYCFCSDGTSCGKCSVTKPLFCDLNKTLVPYCTKCGCDANLSCDANTQQCVAPDFNVPSMSFSHPPGGSATITAQVKNIGTKAYQGTLFHKIDIYNIQGQPLMGSLINRTGHYYAIGGYTTESFTWTPQNGSYYAKTTADYYNNVFELKENNNIRLLYFTISDMNQDQNHLACVNQNCVLVPGQGQDLCHSNADCNASGVDLIVNSIPHTFGMDSNDSNGTIYWLDYNVLIQNIGTQTYAGSVSLSAWQKWDDSNASGNFGIAVWCTVNLPPMAKTSCYHRYSTGYPAGWHTIGATVDNQHLISELNENNNDKNVTFHIP